MAETTSYDDASDLPEVATFVAFGHRFTDYPSGLAEDLITLEREGAIYSHFADEDTIQPDGTAQFRYYRIPLLPQEIFGYVEASLAYQAYSKAVYDGFLSGRLSETSAHEDVLEVGLEAVPAAIAERVRRYGDYGRTSTRHGDVIDIRGCHASFYPDGLEALVCGRRRERYEELPAISTQDSVALAMQVLNGFAVAARVLGDRQRQRPPFEVENEYDVQDLLYALLRAVFVDAQREEWTPKAAGSAKRIDIVLPQAQVVIETKFVRDRGHAARVADELRIDFESYHHHSNCRRLIAMVWDPSGFVADPEQFEADLSGLRQKGQHSFEVSVLVRR